MPWTTTHNPALGIIETVFNGPVTGADLQEATTKIITLGKEAGTTRFLVDTSEMELSASLVDVLNLPAEQYEKEGVDRHSRVAVILPRQEKSIAAVRFYETACRNRGWLVMLFPERQSAVDWLLNKNTSHNPGVREG